MKRDLPNYVFEKKYDNFYLLTEFDVIFNDEFTKKIDLLLKKIGTNEIIIELEIPLSYQSVVPNKVQIPKPISLNNFYEMKKVVNKTDLFYYMFNFFISDESKLWKIYVSLEKEISILACLNEENSTFKSIINPYKEENLEQKYKIISDMFGTPNDKKEFIDNLEHNYGFSKFC
jgi:hypothetical protein